MPQNPLRQFNNKTGLLGSEGIPLIKTIVAETMNYLQQKESYDLPTGYWGVRYETARVKLEVGSHRGGLEYDLLVDGDNVTLANFDKDITGLFAASRENIIYLLDLVRAVIAIMGAGN